MTRPAQSRTINRDATLVEEAMDAVVHADSLQEALDIVGEAKRDLGRLELNLKMAIRDAEDEG